MQKTFTDKELLEQIALSNTSAFKALHDKYSDKMLLYAYNILKHKESSEDIVQNIFADLWSKRKESKIENIKPYLFRAVRNRVFKFIRDRKFTNEELTRLSVIDLSDSVSKKMEYNELEEAVHKSVNKLPKRCKEIFELSRFQFKSHKEISEELNISNQAVKNQISKALAQIKKDLKKEHYLFYMLYATSFFDHII